MRTKIALVIVAAVVLLVVMYALCRSPGPAPAGGAETRQPVAANRAEEARALAARLKAQSELAAAGKPFIPARQIMADAIRREPGGQEEVDEQKAAAALQKLRTQMEWERASVREPIPKVQAIMRDAGRFTALVGEGLVSEGDTVQGYRVKKIQADGVEFEKDGQTWVQKVN
jgi:hypothetical protein